MSTTWISGGMVVQRPGCPGTCMSGDLDVQGCKCPRHKCPGSGFLLTGCLRYLQSFASSIQTRAKFPHHQKNFHTDSADNFFFNIFQHFKEPLSRGNQLTTLPISKFSYFIVLFSNLCSNLFKSIHGAISTIDGLVSVYLHL